MFFLLSLLVFKRLVTWKTLFLNKFCGKVGKGKLLIPFLIPGRNSSPGLLPPMNLERMSLESSSAAKESF